VEVTAGRVEKSVYSKVTTWACPELVDTGVQYVSRGDVERLEQHGIQRSMSRLLLVSDDELTEATEEPFTPGKCDVPRSTPSPEASARWTVRGGTDGPSC